MKLPKLYPILATVVLALAACTATPTTSPGASGAAGGGDRGDMRIVVVTHGQASDPFWSVVKNGVDQAQADLGITVEYNAPQTFDMPAMAQLIDTAVASEPDGIVAAFVPMKTDSGADRSSTDRVSGAPAKLATPISAAA